MIDKDRLERIERDISMLCSPQAAGRLSGSAGAWFAAEWLAGRLREIGFFPCGEEGYFQRVDVPASRLTDPVTLSVGGKEYRHRVDFAEMTAFSSGGSVRGELTVARDNEDVDPDCLRGKVVLIPEKPEDIDLRATAQAAAEVGVLALLVEFGEPRWFHKTVGGSQDYYIPVIRVRKNIAQELERHHAGELVQLNLPLEIGTRECRNVFGIFPGAGAGALSEKHTLVLSAHYDHLGDDPGGYRFPGAIDNASGVATILEAASELVRWSSRTPLPFNVLVAFFTGEETGMHGARHFIAHPPVALSAAINIDSVGFHPELTAMRVGHGQPGDWFPDIAAKIIPRYGAEVRWIAGGDDSAAFLSEGIPVVGLGQKPTEPLERNIHTPDDTPEGIDQKPVIVAVEIMLEMIEYLAAHPHLLDREHLQ